MQKKLAKETRVNNPASIVFDGRFAPNGSSPIVNNSTNVIGKRFSVARTGVGTFEVTIDGALRKIYSARAELWLNAASAGYATHVLGAPVFTSTSTKITFVVLVNTTGTFAATDIAANANNWISFEIVATDSAEV